jgi:DNA replication and repair protein RecF
VWLQSLELKHFRNYQSLKLDMADSRQIALVGFNAQGKTNFLESLFLLAFASSFRTSTLTEMIHWGEAIASIEGAFGYEHNVPVHLKFVVHKNGKRLAAVNYAHQKRLANYIGHVKLICFTSKDLMMLTGQPSERRQFIDLLLIQSYPRYYSYLQNYTRLLKQRNILLKNLKKRSAFSPDQNFEELESWDIQISQIGAQIIKRRQTVLLELGYLLNTAHAHVSLLAENIQLGYRSNLGENVAHLQVEEIEQILAQQLKQKRIGDIIHGHTSVGPHRDDLSFSLDGHELRFFGSQGQIRTVALALKIAEMNYLSGLFHEPPILLLDDVFSELDIKRQQALVEHIQKPGIQTFLTTTHLEGPVQRFFGGNAKILHVSAGQVYQ